jgi:hypothetical protein
MKKDVGNSKFAGVLTDCSPERSRGTALFTRCCDDGQPRGIVKLMSFAISANAEIMGV